MPSKKVLVSGATGATGSATVDALTGSGVDVRALVHSEGPRSEALRELGVEVVIGDLLNIDSVREALEGVDAAYFVYPVQPGLIDATVYFAQAALEAQVGAVVNLSQRTARRDSGSHAARDHWIAERVFDRSGVPVTHLRPTLFAEWLLYDFARQGVINENILALPFGKASFAPLAAADQGRVIATILQNPEPHGGKTYLLNGPSVMDGEAIAAELGEGLGRSIRYVPVPIEKFQAAVAAVPRLSDFFAQHIGAVVDDLVSGRLTGTNDTVEELTGKSPMGIRQFARVHRSELTSGA